MSQKLSTICKEYERVKDKICYEDIKDKKSPKDKA